MASGHIRRRTTSDGSTRFDVRYRRGGRYTPLEHAGTFKTKKDATARLELVNGWLAGNLDPKVMLAAPIPTVTLAQVADDWLASRLSISPGTRDNYRRCALKAVDVIGDVPVDQVTPQVVRDYIAQLAATMKPGGVHQQVMVLRMILDHADLPVNPARHRSVELPRRERRDLQPPDADELVAILTHLAVRYRPVLLLMEQSALRVGEALALEPADIRTDTILVRRETTKTRRAREVPCPEWLAERVEPPFTMTRQRMWNALAQAADDAGVPRYGPHQWRHRRATLWHLDDVPPVEVSRRMGHAKVSMSLDTYTHARPVVEADPHRLASLLM